MPALPQEWFLCDCGMTFGGYESIRDHEPSCDLQPRPATLAPEDKVTQVDEEMPSAPNVPFPQDLLLRLGQVEISLIVPRDPREVFLCDCGQTFSTLKELQDHTCICTYQNNGGAASQSSTSVSRLSQEHEIQHGPNPKDTTSDITTLSQESTVSQDSTKSLDFQSAASSSQTSTSSVSCPLSQASSVSQDTATVSQHSNVSQNTATVSHKVSQKSGTSKNSSPLYQKAGTSKDSTPLYQKASTSKDLTPLYQKASTSKDLTPLYQKASTSKDLTPLYQRASTSKDLTPLYQKASTSKESSPLYQKAGTSKDSSPLYRNDSTSKDSSKHLTRRSRKSSTSNDDSTTVPEVPNLTREKLEFMYALGLVPASYLARAAACPRRRLVRPRSCNRPPGPAPEMPEMWRMTSKSPPKKRNVMRGTKDSRDVEAMTRLTLKQKAKQRLQLEVLRPVCVVEKLSPRQVAPLLEKSAPRSRADHDSPSTSRPDD